MLTVSRMMIWSYRRRAFGRRSRRQRSLRSLPAPLSHDRRAPCRGYGSVDGGGAGGTTGRGFDGRVLPVHGCGDSELQFDAAAGDVAGAGDGDGRHVRGASGWQPYRIRRSTARSHGAATSTDSGRCTAFHLRCRRIGRRRETTVTCGWIMTPRSPNIARQSAGRRTMVSWQDPVTGRQTTLNVGAATRGAQPSRRSSQ